MRHSGPSPGACLLSKSTDYVWLSERQNGASPRALPEAGDNWAALGHWAPAPPSTWDRCFFLLIPNTSRERAVV